MQINANAANSAQRVQRVFKKLTRVSIQVRGVQTVTLAREQGEAANANDGIQLTQTSTSPPYDCWWKGEMWFTSTVAQTGFVLLIIGEACD